MAKEIIMPKMGNTVESVIIGEINISVGDKITKGDILFDYETDKSTSEYKAEDSGEVLLILMEPGDEISVLAPIIIVGDKGDDISEWEKTKQVDKKDETVVDKKDETVVVKKDEVLVENDNSSSTTSLNETVSSEKSSLAKGKISPRAKKMANELGVDISKVTMGTGLGGKIVEADVMNFYHNDGTAIADESPTSSLPNLPKIDGKEFEDIPYSKIRKAIGNLMTSSIAHGAQLTLGATFDATEILKLRKYIKENYQKLGLENSSINDIFVFALSRTLPRFPHINSIIEEDFYRAYNVAHISVAVDAPIGLLVPVVKNASNLTLGQITKVTKGLIQKAREGKITANDQKGGTFTISNLGLSGVSFFTPILNAPQSALLGIGSPQKKLRLNNNKDIEEYPEIMLSLTMDHRPFDGAKGAEFLQELIKVLENIYGLLI